jgi:hypothetical protein
VFISLNLDNKCDINLGFKTAHDIPVYLTVFISSALGLLSSLPFFIKRKKQKPETDSGLIFEKKNSIWAKRDKRINEKTDYGESSND